MLMRTTTAKILVALLIMSAVVMPMSSSLVRAQPRHVQGQVEGPVFHTLAEAYKYRVEHKDQPVVPQGVNDPDCRVTPEHKQAVVLVHGTDTTMYADYSHLGAAIAQAGWCTYGFDYGAGPAPDKGFGWAPIEQSAEQLDQTVAAARRSSGAESVVFVGFSQGATVARYWMHSDPAHAAETHKWIGLASPTRGGNFYGLAHLAQTFPWLHDVVGSFGLLSPALNELMTDSEFNQRLNTPAETVPGVRHVTISTRFDEMMPEGHNAAIRAGQNAEVDNIVVQDVCPDNHGGHMFMTYNPTVIDLVLSELGAVSRDRVRCAPVPLGYSMPDVMLFDAPRKLLGGTDRPTPVDISTM